MGGGRTQKAFLPALLASLLVAALLASPAAAQGPEDGPIYKSQEGPGHELYANGSIIVVGDAASSCEALVREARSKPVEPGPALLMQVEACEEAGFSVPGGLSSQIVAASGLILTAVRLKVDPCGGEALGSRLRVLGFYLEP